MEISRWRQPPDSSPLRPAPRRVCRGLRRPAGADAFFSALRWLTPPANFRKPSGLEEAEVLRAGQRPTFIPAWGHAPGSADQERRGLKARFIPAP